MSVPAGDDFFRFANGTWVDETEIPADRSSITSFSTVDDRVKARVRTLIAQAAQATRGSEKQIGAFFAAYMDEATIEARGLASLQSELETIAAVGDVHALASYLGQSLRTRVRIDPLPTLLRRSIPELRASTF